MHALRRLSPRPYRPTGAGHRLPPRRLARGRGTHGASDRSCALPPALTVRTVASSATLGAGSTAAAGRDARRGTLAVSRVPPPHEPHALRAWVGCSPLWSARDHRRRKGGLREPAI